MNYHIPCVNDASAYETAQSLEKSGYSVEVARSYHPALKAYVLVHVAEGQDTAPIVDRGGYSVDALLNPTPAAQEEDEGEVFEANDGILEYPDEFEEETEPEPEETDGEP